MHLSACCFPPDAPVLGVPLPRMLQFVALGSPPDDPVRGLESCSCPYHHSHELNQGVAPPELTLLTYRWRERASGNVTRTQAKQIVYAHVCMC